MKKIILILIILLAFALRFYRLDSYPAINADEASIGYDAYSLLETGRDQHGNSWPINFQSFNDYKPGLYVYLVMPFVKIFGLTDWAVRIPNALLGVITVYLIYLIVKELFGKNKQELSLVASFFLAISPWHLHFSRGGWEANTATFLLALGIFFWLKFVNSENKIRYLILSSIFCILTLYCYQATRVVTPLIVLALFIIYRKEVFISSLIKTRKFIAVILFSFVLLLPLIFDFAKGAALSRASGVGLFADQGAIARIQEQRGEHGNTNSIVGKVIHNKLVNYGLAFMDNWASHFHGEFLFLTGDEVQRNKVPEMGVMYLFDIVFLPIGVFMLFKRKMTKEKKVLFIWILVSPIASSLTFQAPSALRAQNIVIPLVIISAYGAVSFINLIRKIRDKKLSNFLVFLIRMLILWNVVRYGHLYYSHMSKQFPFSSQYGVKELVNYINKTGNNYEKIVVTDRYDQPYILFLYYLKYSPKKFQSEHVLTGRDGFGFSTVRGFDKYVFTSIKSEEIKVIYPKGMIAGTVEEIPADGKIIQEIYGSNDYLYFRIIEN